MTCEPGGLPSDLRTFVEGIQATIGPHLSLKMRHALRPIPLPTDVRFVPAELDGRTDRLGSTRDVIGILNPIWHPYWQDTRDFSPMELLREALTRNPPNSSLSGVTKAIDMDEFVTSAGESPTQFSQYLHMFRRTVMMALNSSRIIPNYGDVGDTTVPILLTSRLWRIGERTEEFDRVILDPERMVIVAGDDRMVYYAKLAAWLSSVSLLPLLVGHIAADDEAAARAIEAMLALLAFAWLVRPARPS
jgi:hypothetical protein